MEISKRFCVEFAAICMVLILLLSYLAREKLFLVMITLSLFCALLTVTLYNPLLLRTPARGWYRLGKGMGVLMTPVFLFVVFYCFLFPYSIILKIRSHKPIETSINKQQSSYWVDVSKELKTDLIKQY